MARRAAGLGEVPSFAPLGPICRQKDLLLALGIVSAPDYHGRRLAQRHSWMRWPNVGHDGEAQICGTFVVRAGRAPRGVSTALQREAVVHNDMLLATAIAWNESRVRGPVLTLAHWLQHAAAVLPHARFVGKLDDDAYLHAPDLERLLRAALSHSSSPSRAHIFLGVLTWYHWYAKLFDTTRHGWSYSQAFSAGAQCRSRALNLPSCGESGCGTCVGPFIFGAGYLVVGSRPLIESVLAAGGLVAEAAQLARLDPKAMVDKAGHRHVQVMEDVWLGSVIHRYPLPQPVRYISLIGGRGGNSLYVDQWDFRLTRTALVVHVITKQLDRFLAIHDYMRNRPRMHCSRPFQLRCASNCATRAATAEGTGGHGIEVSNRSGSGSSSRSARGVGGTRTDVGRQRRHERCAAGSAAAETDGRVVDEMCSVHTTASASDGGAPCCGRQTNASCGQLFGSNKWPLAYRPQLAGLRRFEPVRLNA